MTKKEPPRNKKVFDRSTQHPPYGPRPPAARPDDVWERIDDLLVEDSPVPSGAEPKQRKRGEARRKKRMKRKIRLLDVAGVAVWFTVIVKLFVGDLDRVLFASFAPEVVWLLDLRWFLVLALAALMLMLFKARTLGIGLAYVVGYPLVVLLWKLPKLLVKKRSPLLVVGLAGLTISLAVRSKRFVIALAIACLSGLIVVLSNTPWLVLIGMASMLITLLWWLTVTGIDLLRTSGYVSAQEKLIEKILSWKIIEKFVTAEHPDQISLKSWKAEDAKKYRDSAGNALLARRVLYFWAYSLDEYRKGPTIVLLNASAAVGMIVQVIFVFSFLNYGAFSIDPAQFLYAAPPEWWSFAYYSAAGSYFGEIGALAPVGGIAIVVKLVNGIVGSVGVGMVLISIFLGYRGRRADVTSISAIELLKSKAEYVGTVSAEQFQMSLRELEERLVTASWGLLGALTWLGTKMPEAWLGEIGGPESAGRADGLGEFINGGDS